MCGTGESASSCLKPGQQFSEGSPLTRVSPALIWLSYGDVRTEKFGYRSVCVGRVRRPRAVLRWKGGRGGCGREGCFWGVGEEEVGRIGKKVGESLGETPPGMFNYPGRL